MLGILLSLAGATCPEVGPELVSAHNDVMTQDLNYAQDSLLKAVEALTCSPPIPAEQAATYWQIQAMVWRFQGHESEPKAWVASKRSSSEVWNPDYGDDAKGARDEAQPEAGPPTMLTVRGFTNAHTLWVNGEVTEHPAALTQGLHLVQVGTGDVAFHAAVLDVGADEILMPLPRKAAVEEPEPPAPEPVAEEPVPVPKPEAPAAEAVEFAFVSKPSVSLLGVTSGAGSLCIQEDEGDCEAPTAIDGTVTHELNIGEGLTVVYAKHQEGSEVRTQPFYRWLDQTPPVVKSAAAVPTPNGWDILVDASFDKETHITGYRLAADRKYGCEQPWVESSSPTFRVETAVANTTKAVVCAVDAAGNISAAYPIRLSTDAFEGTSTADPILAHATERATRFVDELGNLVCQSKSPNCTKFEPKDEVSPRKLGATLRAQTIYTFHRDDPADPIESTAKHYLFDRSAPVDGKVERLLTPDHNVVWWEGFFDPHSQVKGYRMVANSSSNPKNCSTGDVVVDTLQARADLPLGDWRVRVCAVDHAGNTSKGTLLRIKDR